MVRPSPIVMMCRRSANGSSSWNRQTPENASGSACSDHLASKSLRRFGSAARDQS